MIVCRSQSEIARLRRANQLVAAVLAKLKAMVAPGVTTMDLDVEAEAMVRAAGAVPAFKGYHGYPATVCASVNEQVVHGIPSKQAARARRHRVDRHGGGARRVLRRLRGHGAGGRRVARRRRSCCG